MGAPDSSADEIQERRSQTTGAPLLFAFRAEEEGTGEMLDATWRGETPPRVGVLDGVRGHWFGTRFIPSIGGGSDDDPKPGEGDPPKAGDPPTGKDGTAFDAERAQRTIDALREEIKASKGTAKELETARAKLKEIEDANKSETERATAKATEEEQKRIAAEQRAADLVLRLTVERTATRLGFHDPDDAYRLIDRKAVDVDDDGEPSNVEKLLADLAKAKPHLVKADGDEKKKTAERGTPTTPKPDGKPESREDRVKATQKELAGSGRYTPL